MFTLCHNAVSVRVSIYIGALSSLSRYVPPDQARAVASVQASVSGSSASSTGSTPEVQPLKTLQLNKTPLRQVTEMHTEPFCCCLFNNTTVDLKKNYLEKSLETSLSSATTGQSPGLGRSQAHSAAQEKKFDLLSDLGGDIFAAPPTQTASSTNFANFAHFPSQSGKISFSEIFHSD